MSRALHGDVMRRLETEPATTLAGLRAIYSAWCLRVPFDNVRKMIALRRGNGAPLPGLDPEEFFEAWLEHGTGGTCWPTSRALRWLLEGCGFDAREAAASMRDLGPLNHGTVLARIDGSDWLVDSSLLTNVPLPLGDGLFVHSDPAVAAELEREDGSWVLWTSTPPNPVWCPCRVFSSPAEVGLWATAYEESRQRSPFNQRLYARRNRPGSVVILGGSMRHVRTADGVVSQELSPEALLASLRDDFGISGPMLDTWIRAGGLTDSMEPSATAPPPHPARPRPSER